MPKFRTLPWNQLNLKVKTSPLVTLYLLPKSEVRTQNSGLPLSLYTLSTLYLSEVRRLNSGIGNSELLVLQPFHSMHSPNSEVQSPNSNLTRNSKLGTLHFRFIPFPEVRILKSKSGPNLTQNSKFGTIYFILYSEV